MNKILLFAGAAAGLGLLASTAKATPSGTGHITAIAMPLDKTSCQGNCTINGSVTWKNEGTAADTFTPTILVNNIPKIIGAAITLQPGEQTAPIPFNVAITGETAFCPEPD